jgi:hypothetical protein
MAKAPVIKLVFTDDDNDTIKRPNIVTYYREKFGAEYDGDGELTASDDKILATLEAVPGDESNPETREAIRTARWEALLTLVETVTYETPSAIESPLGHLASEIGSRIDKATDQLVSEAVDNKEKYEGAPLEIAEHLITIFDGHLDDDGTIKDCAYVLENFPWPGSKESEAPAGSNQRFDRYEWHDQNGTKHKGYFLGDLHDSTPEGRQIKLRLETIKLMKVDPTSNKIGYDYRTMFLVNGHVDPHKRDAEEQYLRNRRTSRINRMARAIKYIMNAARLPELKNVTYTFVHEEKEKRYRANKPIKLLSGSGKKMVPYEKNLSLSQFCNLRIDEALRLGGSMANLTGTMKRVKQDTPDAQGGGTDKLEGQKGDPSVEQIEAWVNAFNSANDPGEKGEFKIKADLYHSKIMSHFNKQGSEADERLLDFRDYVATQNEILAHFLPRINKIEEKKAKDSAKAA